MSLYVAVDPTEGRIRLVCTQCRINRITLTYAEAKRDAKTHREWHQEARAE